VHLAEKALQELRDEVMSPAETAAIPLTALLELIDA
jgi:hypothetical protein